MTFEPIEQERASEAVIDQFEKLILKGVLSAGQRLPSERELASQLNVSRPTVREAVNDLQQRGLLISRKNAGLFVAEFIGTAFKAPLIELIAKREEAVGEYLKFRIDLETMAAERAAVHGSEIDHQALAEIYAQMKAVHETRDTKREVELDVQFHLAIIEASNNMFLVHLARSMFELLRQGVFFNRQMMIQNSVTRDQLLEHHKAITEAILARDPQLARSAIEAHLTFTEKTLAQAKIAQENDKTARLRQAHRAQN